MSNNNNTLISITINNYKNPLYKLNGCNNDGIDLMKALEKHYSFKPDDFIILKDDKAIRSYIIPTITKVIQNSKTGDNIILQYSGHGTQYPSFFNNDEHDKLDEAICLYDFSWSNTLNTSITDKEFNSLFFIIPEGVNFYFIGDCCHSQDLTKAINCNVLTKYITPPELIQKEINRIKELNNKRKALSNNAKNNDKRLVFNGVGMFACLSNQTSADASFFNRYNGAFTFYLVKELNKKDSRKLSLNSLLYNVNKSLRNGNFSQVANIEGNIDLINKSFLNYKE